MGSMNIFMLVYVIQVAFATEMLLERGIHRLEGSISVFDKENAKNTI